MRVFLIENGFELAPEIKSRLDVVYTYRYNNTNNKYAEWGRIGLELDKFIFDKWPRESKLVDHDIINVNPVNWVLYCENNNVLLDDFLTTAKHFPVDYKTVFCTAPRKINSLGNKNFYCRPNVFSLISNIYKLNSTSDTLDDTIFAHTVSKLNLDIEVLPIHYE